MRIYLLSFGVFLKLIEWSSVVVIGVRLVEQSAYVSDHMEQIGKHHFVHAVSCMYVVNMFVLLVIVGTGGVPDASEHKGTFT